LIWRGLAVLSGAAGVVILGVVALALITVPDEPTFAEGLEEAEVGEDGSVDFLPTAIGGEVVMTGARDATITLERQVDGPTFGLGNAKAKVFFDAHPLVITQMSYDGLAFFPDPEDCAITEGRHNEDLGLAAVRISCPELVDIRDNGSIALEGYAAMPADLVVDLDLPEIGGTMTVGEEVWEINEALLLIGPSFGGSGAGEIGLSLGPEGSDEALFLSYDMDSGSLSPATLLYDGDLHDISGARCDLSTEELMVVNPQVRVLELTIRCEEVGLEGAGSVTIEGTVTYEQILLDES
jgi:hypothetical protein